MDRVKTAVVWDFPPPKFQVEQLADGAYRFDEHYADHRLRARNQSLNKLQREAQTMADALRSSGVAPRLPPARTYPNRRLVAGSAT